MRNHFPDHHVISLLGSLSLRARNAMLGNVSGLHRSPHRGASVEFAEYRKYAPGDDTRRLDWKVYARSDRYYIKEYEADTNLRAYMVIDTSASMGYKSASSLYSKYEMACHLSAVLDYIAVRQGDAVGMAMCGNKATPILVPPSRKPAHLQVLYDYMESTKPEGKTELLALMHAFTEKISRRGLVIIFSDLFLDLEELGKVLQHLHYRHHDVAVFHMMDEEELTFDFTRPMRFVGMEGEGKLLIEPSFVVEEYHTMLERYLDRVRRVCYGINADYRLVKTSESLEDVLRDFLIKRQGKRG